MTLSCYIFEAKSIQHYIFQTGKLKHAILASERLSFLLDEPTQIFSEATSHDRDTLNDSLLMQVLLAGGFTHDLEEISALSDTNSPAALRIVRANGAAIQILSHDRDTLVRFRQLWTLAVAQFLPGMDFVDVIATAPTPYPNIVIGKAFEQLNGARSAGKRMLPEASANLRSTSRTMQAQLAPLPHYPAHEYNCDLATAKHLIQGDNTYTKLHRKFRPEDSVYGQFHFTDFTELQAQAGVNEDVALIHLDGNAFGKLINNMRNIIKDIDDVQVFCGISRAFSQSIGVATIMAAKDATTEVAKQMREKEGDIQIPIRPLVCGGDDVTLLIREQYAMTFIEKYCAAFKHHSKRELKQINRKLSEHGYSQQSLQLQYLTASGGVLYQKIKQPFVTGNHLVEALAKQAKGVSDQLADPTRPELPKPATVSALHISSVYQDELADIRSRALSFVQKNQSGNIHVAAQSYVLGTRTDTNYARLQAQPDVFYWCDIQRIVTLMKQEITGGVTLACFRKMLTELGQGKLEKAKQLFERARDEQLKLGNNNTLVLLQEAFGQCYAPYSATHFWLSQDTTIPSNAEIQTIQILQPQYVTVLLDIVRHAKTMSSATFQGDHHAA